MYHWPRMQGTRRQRRHEILRWNEALVCCQGRGCHRGRQGQCLDEDASICVWNLRFVRLGWHRRLLSMQCLFVIESKTNDWTSLFQQRKQGSSTTAYIELTSLSIEQTRRKFTLGSLLSLQTKLHIHQITTNTHKGRSGAHLVNKINRLIWVLNLNIPIQIMFRYTELGIGTYHKSMGGGMSIEFARLA